MLRKIQNRLNSEQGFTLIELLVVIIILGILTAIAVPSYLSFRGSAEQNAAKANVRSALPAAESWYQNNGTYAGMAAAGALASQAPGVSYSHVVVSTDGAAYCIDDTQGTHNAYYVGGNQVTGTSGFTTDTATSDATIISDANLCSDVVSG